MSVTTTNFCHWCGKDLVGKRSHAQYCDSSCRGKATLWRQGRSGDADKALGSASTPPIAQIRAEQEDAKAHWSMVVDEAIVRHFRRDPSGTLHADDLESLGIPAEHRNVIGSQFAKWVNRKRMVECGRRASVVPSRNAAKSNEYRLTKKGRDLVAGPGGEESPGGLGSGTVGSGEPGAHHTEAVGAGQVRGERDQGRPSASPSAGADKPDHLFDTEPVHMSRSSAFSPENEFA